MVFQRIGLITLFFALQSTLAYGLEGKIETPYQACQNVLIVDEEKYKKNNAEWDEFADKCNQQLLATPDVATHDIFTVLHHVKYKDFATKVATEVKTNLERQAAYYECTSKCFEGAKSCKEKNKTIDCKERKVELLEKLKVDARKARIQLALSRSSSDLFSINPRNILTLSEDQRINKDLKEFEWGPNQVGLSKLTDGEFKEAKRRLKSDQEKVLQEARARGLQDNRDHISIKLYNKVEEHQREYQELVYSKSPMLSIIDRPEEFVEGVPKWSDKSLSKAAKELIDHAKRTQEMVDMSLKSDVLEYSRKNADAVRYGIISRMPGTTPRKELLFYLGMKSAVEEVLKKDPSQCGLATTMYKRLVAKDTQMMYLSAGVTLAPLAVGIAGKFVHGASKAASAIGVVQSNWMVGVGLASSFPIESTIKYNATVREASMGLRSGADVQNARTQMKLAAGMTFVNSAALISRNAKAIDAFGQAMRNSKYSQSLRTAAPGVAGHNHIVNQFLGDKIDEAANAKILTANEVMRLKEKAGIEMMDSLAVKIQHTHPDFFKDEKNMSFFLKSASIAAKKKAGDPADLVAKMQDILIDANTESTSKWNPKARKGLLVVVENTMDELRSAFKSDPATYAKFTSSIDAKRKIFHKALIRSGMKSDKADIMTKCALPGK